MSAVTQLEMQIRIPSLAKRIALKTPYFISAPLLLANTDDVIFLPSRLGQTLAQSAPLSLIAASQAVCE